VAVLERADRADVVAVDPVGLGDDIAGGVDLLPMIKTFLSSSLRFFQFKLDKSNV
jgi:hypothetical protein